MNGYRLLTYATSAGSPQAGILVDDRIHAAAPLLGSSGLKDAASVHTILHHWDRAHSALRDAAASLDCGDGLPLDDVTFEGTAASTRRIGLRRGELLGPFARDGGHRQAYHGQTAVDDKAG